MNSKDLEVGKTYYIESTNRWWDQPHSRDLTNRDGRNKARLESLDRYRAVRSFERTGTAGAAPAAAGKYDYIPSESGRYFKVTVMAGTADHLSQTRKEDHVDYVMAREFRGEWDEVVARTRALLDERRRKAAEKEAAVAKISTARAAIIERAAHAGLTVRDRKDGLSRVSQFVIDEDDLVQFLDGLDTALAEFASRQETR